MLRPTEGAPVERRPVQVSAAPGSGRHFLQAGARRPPGAPSGAGRDKNCRVIAHLAALGARELARESGESGESGESRLATKTAAILADSAQCRRARGEFVVLANVVVARTMHADDVSRVARRVVGEERDEANARLDGAGAREKSFPLGARKCRRARMCQGRRWQFVLQQACRRHFPNVGQRLDASRRLAARALGGRSVRWPARPARSLARAAHRALPVSTCDGPMGGAGEASRPVGLPERTAGLGSPVGGAAAAAAGRAGGGNKFPARQ